MSGRTNAKLEGSSMDITLHISDEQAATSVAPESLPPAQHEKQLHHACLVPKSKASTQWFHQLLEALDLISPIVHNGDQVAKRPEYLL
jgi:hypothetical protein